MAGIQSVHKIANSFRHYQDFYTVIYEIIFLYLSFLQAYNDA